MCMQIAALRSLLMDLFRDAVDSTEHPSCARLPVRAHL